MTIKAQIVVHEIGDTRKVVEVLQRDRNEVPTLANIRDARAVVSVVAKRESDGSWEPVYGLRDGERFDLPPCFALNDDALKALDLTS